MKLLFDESMPRPLGAYYPTSIEILTVQRMGWAGRFERRSAAPAKLIFRTYQQHQDDEWTSISLDLIDRLCLEGISHAASEFEQFER